VEGEQSTARRQTWSQWQNGWHLTIELNWIELNLSQNSKSKAEETRSLLPSVEPRSLLSFPVLEEGQCEAAPMLLPSPCCVRPLSWPIKPKKYLRWTQRPWHSLSTKIFEICLDGFWDFYHGTNLAADSSKSCLSWPSVPSP
jgi:hypothetical protein